MSMISSPAFASARVASKSILKRPATLPMSPGAVPYVASFSIHVSGPTSPKLNLANVPLSPHVHFPTPSTLTSTFPVYSPGSYDRSAIVVSANPLAMPSYGERVYSPTTDAFKALDSPGAFRTFSDIEIIQSPLANSDTASSVVLDTPTVPILLAPLANTPKPKSRASLRFRETLAKKAEQVLSRDENAPSPKLPRSPYPRGGAKENVTPISTVPRRLMSTGAVNKANVLSPVYESPMRDAMTDMRSPSFPASPLSANGNPFGFGMPLSPLPRARLADVPVSPPATLMQFVLLNSPMGKALKSPGVNHPHAELPTFSAILNGDA